MKGGEKVMTGTSNEIKPLKIGIAAGIMLTVISLLCALLFVIAPETALSLANNIFHGIDIEQIAKTSVSFSGVLAGLITAFIVGFISGWIFGFVYKKMA